VRPEHGDDCLRLRALSVAMLAAKRAILRNPLHLGHLSPFCLLPAACCLNQCSDLLMRKEGLLRLPALGELHANRRLGREPLAADSGLRATTVESSRALLEADRVRLKRHSS
jgi:hypothetical protein